MLRVAGCSEKRVKAPVPDIDPLAVPGQILAAERERYEEFTEWVRQKLVDRDPASLSREIDHDRIVRTAAYGLALKEPVLRDFSVDVQSESGTRAAALVWMTTHTRAMSARGDHGVIITAGGTLRTAGRVVDFPKLSGAFMDSEPGKAWLQGRKERPDGETGEKVVAQLFI